MPTCHFFCFLQLFKENRFDINKKITKFAGNFKNGFQKNNLIQLS